MFTVSPWVVILFESQGFEADFVPKRKTPGEFRNLFGFHLAHVAQLVEHVLGKDEVTGSNPVMGSVAVKPRAGRLTTEFRFGAIGDGKPQDKENSIYGKRGIQPFETPR